MRLAKSSLPARKNGFTLTELAIVLGIMGTILSAIWIASAHVSNNQKVNKAVQEVLALSQSVQAFYGPKGQLDAGDLTQIAINNGFYSADMLQSGGCNGTEPQNIVTTTFCPMHPWHGEMSINNSTSQCFGAGVPCAANMYNIYLWGLTNAQCASFLSAIIPQAVSAGLVGFYTDGDGSLAVSSATPLTDAHIVSCNGNTVLVFSM